MSTPRQRTGWLGNSVVWFAAAVLFTATTLGPLYNWRIRIGPPVSGSLLDDWRLNLVFASVHVGVVLLCAAVAVGRRGGRVRQRLTGGRAWSRAAWWAALVGLHVLVAWSAMWSLVEGRSLSQAGLFALTTLSALALGNVATMRQLVVALLVTQHGLTAWGMWAVRRNWVASVDERGHWAGIFFNKNSFGPVAAVALLSLVAWGAFVVTQSSRRVTVIWAPFLAVAAAVDALVLMRANSITPIVGIIGAFGAVGVVALAGVIATRRGLPKARTAFVASIVAVGAAVAGGLALRSVLASVLHRSPTMSGRTELWGWLLDRIGDRPIGGWGWLSVWEEPDLRSQVVARFKIPFATAHSGLIEVAIGAGLIAGACAFVVLLGCALTGIRGAAERPSWATFVGLGAIGYALSVNLLETFIGANLLPWALLLCATAIISLPDRSSGMDGEPAVGDADPTAPI